MHIWQQAAAKLEELYQERLKRASQAALNDYVAAAWALSQNLNEKAAIVVGAITDQGTVV